MLNEHRYSLRNEPMSHDYKNIICIYQSPSNLKLEMLAKDEALCGPLSRIRTD